MDDDRDNDIDYLLNLTETDESSSSSDEGLFGAISPFVCEIHELEKDGPDSENTKPTPGEKIKMKKLKKKRNKLAKQRGLTSSSESSLAPVIHEESKEEFYDAKESMLSSDNQTVSVMENITDASLVTVDPNLEPNPKASTVQESHESLPTLQLQSALSKPVDLPKIASLNVLNTKYLKKELYRDLQVMDKPKSKAKNKKAPSKSNAAKKKTNNGPTCSMFLGELTRKLALKKRQEEESPNNIVHVIIENITNALPIKFSKQSAVKKESPVKIETLQSFAPELITNDTLNIPLPALKHEEVAVVEIVESRADFKMPKMPLVNSEMFKQALEKRKKISMEDVAVNTGGEHDVASEIAKHVGTLKKISLIAEEFNQKTAKNLKEIVDSVQEDLIKKLEEIKTQQKLVKAQTVRIEEGVE